MNIEKNLSIGNPRTLGKTSEIVKYVLANKNKLEELFLCLFSSNEIVRMRAADALEKICREQSVWFEPFIDRLLYEVSLIEQNSVQWHLAQMLGELSLSEPQRKKALKILGSNLISSKDWLVLNFSIDTYAKLFKQNTAEEKAFFLLLDRHKDSVHRTVSKKVQKLLSEPIL
jgi:hypothetical protein